MNHAQKRIEGNKRNKLYSKEKVETQVRVLCGKAKIRESEGKIVGKEFIENAVKWLE